MRKGCRPTIRTGCGFSLRRLSRRRVANSTRSVPSRQGQTFRKESYKGGEAARKVAKRQKVLILFVRSRHCGELNRGLRNLEAPRKGNGFWFFSLVRKEPKVHQRFANLWTPGTIQIAGRYMIVVKVTGIHQVTGNAENCNFSGIAGNDLNRCDVPALQHKIRAKSKRTAAFFANSRLRVVGRGGGGQKRVILGGNKERFVRIKGFLYVKKAAFEGSS